MVHLSSTGQFSARSLHPVRDIFDVLWASGAVSGLIAGLAVGLLPQIRWDRFFESTGEPRNYPVLFSFCGMGILAGLVLGTLEGAAILIAQRILPPYLRLHAPVVAGTAALLVVVPLALIALGRLSSSSQWTPAYVLGGALVLWVVLTYDGTRALHGPRKRGAKT